MIVVQCEVSADADHTEMLSSEFQVAVVTLNYLDGEHHSQQHLLQTSLLSRTGIGGTLSHKDHHLHLNTPPPFRLLHSDD